MSPLQVPLWVPPQWMELPGPFMFSKLWGSHSHNTALETSDQDYLVIYVAPTRKILSLQPPPDTVTRKGPDVEAHEVGKFCRLLLKGNPSMIECLFTERFCAFTGSHWPRLREERQRFLSVRVVEQYIGYGIGQLRRFDTGTRLHTKGGQQSEKWLYHMIRVLLDGKRIASGKSPIVWKERKERRLLMDIREGQLRSNQTISLAKQLIAEIDALKPWPLPKQGDEDFLNDWLLSVREDGHTNWQERPTDGAERPLGVGNSVEGG